MPTPYPILSVCCDSWLAQTRHEVLAKHFMVVTVPGSEDVHRVASSTAFQVVILCHSLSVDESRELESFARLQWCDARILALTSLFEGCRVPHPDCAIAGLDGPRPLIAAIRRLLPTGDAKGLPASNSLADGSSLLGDAVCSQAGSPLASERIEYEKP